MRPSKSDFFLPWVSLYCLLSFFHSILFIEHQLHTSLYIKNEQRGLILSSAHADVAPLHSEDCLWLHQSDEQWTTSFHLCSQAGFSPNTVGYLKNISYMHGVHGLPFSFNKGSGPARNASDVPKLTSISSPHYCPQRIWQFTLLFCGAAPCARRFGGICSSFWGWRVKRAACTLSQSTRLPLSISVPYCSLKWVDLL